MALIPKSFNPSDALVGYIEEIKPYHTKIIEVIDEYIFNESINVTVLDEMDICVNIGVPTLNTLFTYSILEVDQIAKSFKIRGNVNGIINIGQRIEVAFSTFNNGIYNIDNITYDIINDRTYIFVRENILDSLADGNLVNSTIEYCPGSNIKGTHVLPLPAIICDGGYGDIWDSFSYEIIAQDFDPVNTFTILGDQIAHVSELTAVQLVDSTLPIGSEVVRAFHITNVALVGGNTVISVAEPFTSVPTGLLYLFGKHYEYDSFLSCSPVGDDSSETIYATITETINFNIESIQDEGFHVYNLENSSVQAFSSLDLFVINSITTPIIPNLPIVPIGPVYIPFAARGYPASPNISDIIFNTTNNSMEQWNGLTWKRISIAYWFQEDIVDIQNSTYYRLVKNANQDSGWIEIQPALVDAISAGFDSDIVNLGFDSISNIIINNPTQPIIPSQLLAPVAPNNLDLWFYDDPQDTDTDNIIRALRQYIGNSWVDIQYTIWFDGANHYLKKRLDNITDPWRLVTSDDINFLNYRVASEYSQTANTAFYSGSTQSDFVDILSVDAVNNTITVFGNVREVISKSQKIDISQSTVNDGEYTILQITSFPPFSSSTITLIEPLTADSSGTGRISWKSAANVLLDTVLNGIFLLGGDYRPHLVKGAKLIGSNEVSIETGIWEPLNYDVETLDGATKELRLYSSFGDVSTIFRPGVGFNFESILAKTTQFTVDSSSFDGTKTTVVVNEILDDYAGNVLGDRISLGIGHIPGVFYVQPNVFIASVPIFGPPSLPPPPIIPNNAPQILQVVDHEIVQNVPIVIPFNAVDVEGDIIVFSVDILPTGLTLTDNFDGTGVITGIPTVIGITTVTLTATDNGTPNLSDNAIFNIEIVDPATIAPNSAPILNPIGNQIFNNGTNISIPFSATDPNLDNLAFSVSGLPITLDFIDNGNGTGEIFGTPVVDEVLTVIVRVFDDGNITLFDDETFTITINPVAQARRSKWYYANDFDSDLNIRRRNFLHYDNKFNFFKTNATGVPCILPNLAPVIAVIPPQNGLVNFNVNIPINVTDYDGNSIVITSSVLPTGLTLTDNLDGTATITGIPTGASSSTITITATDNGIPALFTNLLFALDIVPLTLLPTINNPPILNPIGNQIFNNGTNISIPFSAVDPNLNNLIFSISGLPITLDFIDNGNGTGEIFGTPVVDEILNVTVRVFDDGNITLFDDESFTITINPVAQARRNKWYYSNGFNPVLNIRRRNFLHYDNKFNFFKTNATGVPCILPNLAPVIAIIPPQNGLVNFNVNIPINVTDYDGNSIVITSSVLPTGLIFTDNLDGTGVITGIPLAISSSTITITATDNGIPSLFTDLLFTLDITIAANAAPPNVGPLIRTIGNWQGVIGFSMPIIDITTVDLEGNNIGLISSTLPAGLTFVDNGNGTGQINGIPTALGTTLVTITATDDGVPIENTMQIFEIEILATLVTLIPTPTNVNNTSTLVIPQTALDLTTQSIHYNHNGPYTIDVELLPEDLTNVDISETTNMSEVLLGLPGPPPFATTTDTSATTITEELLWSWGDITQWFQYVITFVDPVLFTITVFGDATTDVQVNQEFRIIANSDIAGIYTVVSRTFDGTQTDIVVLEVIPNNTLGGYIEPVDNIAISLIFNDTIGVTITEEAEQNVIDGSKMIPSSLDSPYFDIGGLDEDIETINP